MLRISFSKDAAKFLKNIPPKQQRQLAEKLKQLQENPFPQDSSFLKGYSLSRATVGELRIIYSVEFEILEVVLIGKRNDSDVYKKLKRKYN